jgi:predicted DNA-binding protein with PD1-like motif
VTLEPGDPVLESLVRVAEEEKIETAAILEGASLVRGPLRLGWYDLEKGQFGNFRDFNERYDVVSVAGNITRRKETGELALHLHMSFTNAALDYTVRGGHVMVEKKETPDSGSRFRNDFTASPTAEFTLLIENKLDVERRLVPGCPLPLIMPKDDATDTPGRTVGPRKTKQIQRGPS